MKSNTVLLVDDDQRNLFALSSYLEAQGMSVISALGGREALEILKNTTPEIILMDIMMPDMDGFETISHIKNSRTANKVPIIAVTAKAMKGDREKCLNAGADDYISKPVSLPELVLKIQTLTEE